MERLGDSTLGLLQNYFQAGVSQKTWERDSCLPRFPGDVALLFLPSRATIYGMGFLSFRAYIQMKEKVSPPFAVPTTKISPLPVTQGRLKRMAPKPVRAPDPFAPTVRPVATVVPEKVMAKVKPA